MDKKQLRKEIAAKKAALTPAARLAEEAAIWAAVESLDGFAKASAVLLYCSLPDEVSTGDFIRKWHHQKRIILPLVSGDTLLLKEYVPERTHPGYKSIIEPDEDLPDIDPAVIDLAIIPGVAFDRKGLRLGRGKGFYDRLLPALACPTLGVAYRCQLLEALPADPWDRKVSLVITAD